MDILISFVLIVPLLFIIKGFISGYKNTRINALIIILIILFPQNIIAAGNVITFSSLDDLLWSIVVTIQHYTIPIMSIALVFLGIKLVASGEDTATKDLVKNWMLRILIGGVFIFGAAILADLIKLAVGG
jgi:hypothetical protein